MLWGRALGVVVEAPSRLYKSPGLAVLLPLSQSLDGNGGKTAAEAGHSEDLTKLRLWHQALAWSSQATETLLWQRKRRKPQQFVGNYHVDRIKT